MSDETTRTSAIRNYLLGDLPESEAEEIERWYFADGQGVDEVWAMFGAIAEEYLSGALSESESRRFELRLRSTPAMREMFGNEKALFDYAARIAAGTSGRAETDDPIVRVGRKWQWPRAAFFKPTRLVAAGVIALIAFITWFGLKTREGANTTSREGPQQTTMKDQNSPGSITQPSVVPQRPPLSGRAANDKTAGGKNSSKAESPDQGRPAFRINQRTTATFLLSRPRVREEQNDPILEIPVQTGAVQLELELSNDDCTVFSAALFTESGETLQRWGRLRARRDHPIPRVVLRAPADSLKNASYVIKLDCVSPSVHAEQFRFKVEKK